MNESGPVAGPGVRAAASPPTQFPAQYSPALPWGTTRFGMDLGGSMALSATRTPGLVTSSQTSASEGVVPTFQSCPETGRNHHLGLGKPDWCRKLPSTISTASLQSFAGCPRAAYQPGGLPGVLPLASEKVHLEVGFPLRCFQRLSRPNVATQLCRFSDNWYTSGSSSPVLSY